MTLARRIGNQAFKGLCIGATVLAVVILVLLVWSLVDRGHARLNGQLLTEPASYRPARAGAHPAIMGSIWVVVLTGLFAVPIGVAAAIYLEEFQARKNKFTNFVQLNISNLAGVPSIVYGLLGLAVFVRQMHMGRSILAAACTMALLILPMIIIISQEALRAVPRGIRESSLALGATEWQTISNQTLRAAAPGIFTGIILALSRAIGETAPLIVVGAFAYLKRPPESIMSEFTVLPIQIFNWTSDPNKAFRELAGSAILVLLIVLLTMNSVAIYLRQRAGKNA